MSKPTVNDNFQLRDFRRRVNECDLGTGTQVGDTAEMKALGRVFRSSRSREEPLYV